MKKALSLILALVMVFALSTAAFAVGTGEQSMEVTVKVTEVAATYNVEITWEEEQFAFSDVWGGWNTQTHEYENTGWQVSEGIAETAAAEFSVINHSDVEITVAAEYTDKEGLADDALAAQKEIEVELSAESGNNTNTLDTAEKVIYTLSVSGQPANQPVAKFTLGTITLDIT